MASADVQNYIFVTPTELQTSPLFSELFPIDPAIRSAIEKNMRKDGYDCSKPINVWKEENLVLDGHTRLSVAIALNLTDVPICFHDFEDEDQALAYAIANQRDRRNITSADIARCVQAVDSRKKKGGDRGNQYTGGKASAEALPEGTRKSAEKTAKIVGTSRATVERIRTIVDHAKEDPSILKDVLDGKKTIRMGVREVLDKKPRKTREASKSKKPPKPYPIPAPTVQTNGTGRINDSSVVNITPADQVWLESLPLRSKVVSHRFDEDALLYREVAPLLARIKSDMLRVIGHRSPVGMSLMYKALRSVINIPPVEQWQRCPKCGGTGFDKGPCKQCKGGGYLISTL